MELQLEAFLKEFGKQLKTTRKKMGLSQVAAAQAMHIDYRHYQNIEGGKINLRLDTLIKLVNFYKLDKVQRPFNVDACLDILTGLAGASPPQPAKADDWEQLKDSFVPNNHAGFVTFNMGTKAVVQANAKLAQTLGFRAPQDFIGRPLSSLLVAESIDALEESVSTLEVSQATSTPFIVTFRAQPPAYPIPMMAVTHKVITSESGDRLVSALFFDRKSLDEGSGQLNELVSGFKTFMQQYPQLKAV